MGKGALSTITRRSCGHMGKNPTFLNIVGYQEQTDDDMLTMVDLTCTPPTIRENKTERGDKHFYKEVNDTCTRASMHLRVLLSS